MSSGRPKASAIAWMFSGWDGRDHSTPGDRADRHLAYAHGRQPREAVRVPTATIAIAP